MLNCSSVKRRIKRLIKWMTLSDILNIFQNELNILSIATFMTALVEWDSRYVLEFVSIKKISERNSIKSVKSSCHIDVDYLEIHLKGLYQNTPFNTFSWLLSNASLPYIMWISLSQLNTYFKTTIGRLKKI